MNNSELQNLKQIYLKLSEDIGIINTNLNNLLSNINILSLNLNNYCKINDKSIDNGLVDNNKNSLNVINNFLKNNVKTEIIDILVHINEQINSNI